MKKYLPWKDSDANDRVLTKSHVFESFLNFFTKATGAAIALFDLNGAQLTPVSAQNDFCPLIFSLNSEKKSCLGFHAAIAAEALKKQGLTVKTCPYGMACFALPVVHEDSVYALLAGGMLRDKSAVVDFSSLPADCLKFFEKQPSCDLLFLKEQMKQFEGDLSNSFDELFSYYDLNSSARNAVSVFDSAAAFSEDVDISSFLSDIASRLCFYYGTDLGLILLCDDQCSEISMFAFSDNVKKLPFKLSLSEGFTSIVAKSKSTVAVEDLSSFEASGTKNLLPRSMLASPVFFEGLTIGFIYLFAMDEKRRFTDNERKAIELLASDLALAVDYLRKKEQNILRHKSLKRSAERLQVYLSQMGAALSSALNLHQLLRIIVDMGIKLTGATSATLSLIENNKVAMQVHADSGHNLSSSPSLVNRSSLVGWSSDKPLDSSTVSSEACYRTSKQTVSYLGIPITVKDSLIGVLNIYSSGNSKDFSLEKLELLDSFAKQAGLTIENARNYEKEQKRARDASLLYEAVRAIGQTLDFNDLLRVIITKLSQMAQVDRCLIFLYDKDSSSFFFVSSSEGLSQKQLDFLKGFVVSVEEIQPDVWQMLTCGDPFVFSGSSRLTAALKLFSKKFPASGSAMLAPLIAREKVLGMIYLYDSQLPRTFTSYQIDLIKTISMQISVALQRVVLIKKQEEQTNQLRALLNISSMLPTTRSLVRVVRLVTEKASMLLNVSSCALLLVDENNNELALYSGDNLPGSIADENIQRNIASIVMGSKKTYMDIEPEKIADSELRKLLVGNVGHIVLIPLIVKRKVIGVLNLFSDVDKAFRKDQLRFLKSFADQAATAIRNASHEAFVKNKLRELAMLVEAGKSINSSLDFNMVLDLISRCVMRYVSCDAISIMLMEEHNHAYGYERRLVVSNAVGLNKRFTKKVFNLTERIVDEVVAGKHVIHNVADAPEGVYPDILLEMGFKTFLSVPMEYRGNVVGIINVYKQDVANYSESDISLLSILANMAASAIENSKLFEQQHAVAGILQSIVMPQKEFNFPGVDIGYKYIPSGDISGDYFDVISLSKTKFAIVIADVSGKGHSAAIYTVRVKYLLKAYALAGYQPREILSMVNDLIIPETAEDKFISLFYVEVDTKKKIIKYASAGHEPPVFYSSKTGETKLLETEGLLIGIDYDAIFRQEELAYNNGDLLVLYTDGITEAACESGVFFGIDGVIDLIHKNTQARAQTLANKIYTSIQKYTGRRFYDDFSLIAVKL